MGADNTFGETNFNPNKTIHEILIIIKLEVLLNRNKHKPSTIKHSPGLCKIARKALHKNLLTTKEHNNFIHYLKNNTTYPNTLEYSRSTPKLVSLLNYSWDYDLIKPRLQWLTRHINLTKS